MDRYQKRVLRLREHVLNHNSNNNEVTGQPTKEDNKDINAVVYEDMTKAKISELLTKKGIEHNPRDNKSKLIDLLLGSD